MAKMSTTERKKFFLDRLEDHRQNLSDAIVAIAGGKLSAALTIATTIRTLVHETGRSVPLLKSIRPDYLTLVVREGPWATAESLSPLNQRVTLMSLPFAVEIHQDPQPRLSLKPNPDMSTYRDTLLGPWWTKPVLKVFGCAPLTRREVVLGVADKEGAHVDDDMSDNYRKVLESQPLQFAIGGIDLEPINVTRFTVGQSGIELLDMLNRTFPVKDADAA
jgi:hypothetical protein